MSWSYWPDGHAATINDSGDGTNDAALSSVSTWHWDGDTLLYVSQPAATNSPRNAGVYLGFDAVFSTAATTTSTVIQVYDRDWTGTAVSSHSLAGGLYAYGAWRGQGPPARVNCKSGNTAALYPISSDDDGTIAYGAASARSDGYVADVVTLQGVRSYDPNAGHWMTLDSCAGDVHDLMTQKSFMWNSNIPFEYSDFERF